MISYELCYDMQVPHGIEQKVSDVAREVKGGFGALTRL